MQWAERERGGARNELAERALGRMVEPDHLQRCLDILAGLPRLDDPDAVSAYLEGDDAPDLDDKARRRLFDEWFATTYALSSCDTDTAEQRRSVDQRLEDGRQQDVPWWHVISLEWIFRMTLLSMRLLA